MSRPRYVMPPLRGGQDHDHYAYSALNGTRPRIVWPNEAPVAVCVIVVLEHLEWHQPASCHVSPTLAGGYGPRAHPDVTMWSHREYGHRVGIFRVLDALACHGVKPTVAIDAVTARNYPFLVEHCRSRGCEFLAHGWSVNRMVTDRMSESQEQEYVRASLAAIREATGSETAGWFGPEYGESRQTPQILAEAGIRYVCDWVNDEQPYRLITPTGRLFALPITYPLDDADALFERRLTLDAWRRAGTESFDRLRVDGQGSGRVLTLVLRPWLTGQPFRTGTVGDILAHFSSTPDAWFATGTEIIDHYDRFVGDGRQATQSAKEVP